MLHLKETDIWKCYEIFKELDKKKTLWSFIIYCLVLLQKSLLRNSYLHKETKHVIKDKI